MSIYAEPSYDGVERALLNAKTNSWETQRGWLMFDAVDQVRFVTKTGGQFKLPYRSIKSLEYSFYSPIQEAKKAHRPAMMVKLGGKRYLTVRYDLGYGPESTVMVLEPDQYQQVMGSFQSKTGLMVAHPGGYEKHW
jgi:hypothetical protein